MTQKILIWGAGKIGGAHTTKCTNVVGTVCADVAEILFDTGYTDGITSGKEPEK